MEQTMSNSVPSTAPTTQADYNKILQEIIDGHAAKIKEVVNVRAQYIVETIFKYVTTLINQAFVRPEIENVTLTMDLDPASKMSTVQVVFVAPSTPNQTSSTSIVFDQYDGEHKQYINGEIFYRKLSSVLVERLSKELGFCKKDDSSEYEIKLDLPSLIDEV